MTDWNVRNYQTYADFVPRLGQPLLDLLDPKPGERILDLGCGDGALTAALVEAGAQVVGVDSSPAMVAAARARGLDAHVMDVTALDFDDAFDAIFSNAVLHWVKPPEAAAAGIVRALKPGGRLVVEMGGAGNVAGIESALVAALAPHAPDPWRLSPWYFPAPDAYAAVLAAAGLTVETIALIPRPTPLPAGIKGWLVTFAGPFLRTLPPALHDTVLDDAIERMRPALQDADGNWTADYVRLRLVARKPG